jgi:hypothetical protein
VTLKEDGALAMTGNNPLAFTPVYRQRDLSRSLLTRYLQPARNAVLHFRMMYTPFINLADFRPYIAGNNEDNANTLRPELIP